jgi:hypothetical protein
MAESTMTGGIMPHRANKDVSQQEERRASQAEAAFKPVAIPALKAAVHAARKRPSRARPQEVPAILRKDPTD